MKHPHPPKIIQVKTFLRDNSFIFNMPSAVKRVMPQKTRTNDMFYLQPLFSFLNPMKKHWKK